MVFALQVYLFDLEMMQSRRAGVLRRRTYRGLSFLRKGLDFGMLALGCGLGRYKPESGLVILVSRLRILTPSRHEGVGQDGIQALATSTGAPTFADAVIGEASNRATSFAAVHESASDPTRTFGDVRVYAVGA
jgi:hypothetical protein